MSNIEIRQLKGSVVIAENDMHNIKVTRGYNTNLLLSFF